MVQFVLKNFRLVSLKKLKVSKVSKQIEINLQ